MFLSASIIVGVMLLILVWAKRSRTNRKMEQYSITPEALHALMSSNQDVLLIDVRQPLDLLGDSVIIPGAQWHSPEAVRANPSVLPKGQDLVVYCTCPSEKTSRIIVQRALAFGFSRIKILKGGLDGWRKKGFPVEPYTKPFRLNSSGSNRRAGARQ